MTPDRPSGTPPEDRDVADQELAWQAERQRDRVSRGLDGAHKPEDTFPIEEAKEAEEDPNPRP
jgi:hypothetical protein